VFVLALDTSSATVLAAVYKISNAGQPGLIARAAERGSLNPRGHAELLAPLIDDCLHDLEVDASQLAAIVAGVGPGPFTGLRVGLVTAAVMGNLLDIPTYAVCSLDAIAGQFRAVPPLLVATDARRREVYWARYVAGSRVGGPAVCRPAQVPLGDSDRMTGAGARLYADVLGLPLLDIDYPSTEALVRSAADRIRSGAPSEALTPLYLRRPDAVAPAASKPVTP
jgi:tRNA threonylcarbamoyl adenosine modification protein YeaZ